MTSPQRAVSQDRLDSFIVAALRAGNYSVLLNAVKLTGKGSVVALVTQVVVQECREAGLRVSRQTVQERVFDLILAPWVEELAEQLLAERVATGELVVVRTDPDGTRWYQKRSEVENEAGQ